MKSVFGVLLIIMDVSWGFFKIVFFANIWHIGDKSFFVGMPLYNLLI